MTWFLLALLASLFYSISTFIDKYLVSHVVTEMGIGALIVVSGLVGVLLLPWIPLIAPELIALPWTDIVIMILCGALGVVALLPYFYALNQDDTSIVTPIFQTVPVFTFILAYFFLGETLSPFQFWGGVLVIVGALAITLDPDKGFRAPRYSVLLLMLLSSFMFATTSILYKWIVVDANFWGVLFWEYCGAIVAALLFLLSRENRRHLKDHIVLNGKAIISLNALNEVAVLFATMAIRFAQILVPVALVHAVGGTQFLFTLFIGVALTMLFPHLFDEDISRKRLVQKAGSVAVIILGAVLVNL